MASSAVAAVAVLVSIGVAPDVPPELSAAAVRSCNTALGAGRCDLDNPSTHAEWHASVVAPDATLESVRVQVERVSDAQGPDSRDLTFAPEDSPRERWASIGVLIAALVVAGSRELEPPKATPPPTSEPYAEKETRRASPKFPIPSRHPLRLDFRGIVARRTGEGGPELGGEIGASVLPGEGPLFGAASVAAAARLGSDPEASWYYAALGVGIRFGKPTAVLSAELRGALTGEYWLFEATEPGRSEHDGQFRVGGLLGADVLWSFNPRWALCFGVEGLLDGPRIRIDVDGRTAERIPNYGALVSVGLRLMP